MILPKVIEEARVLSHAYPISGVDILTIEAPMIARGALPGQFVQITVPAGGGFLRRPLGIAEVSRDKGWIRLIYRQVGRVIGGGEHEGNGFGSWSAWTWV